LRTSFAAETTHYPVRPIRLIVPQSPGGTTDFTARLIGPRLADRIGQPVVIDNRPGAGSLLGIDLAAKAAPDGYTLLLVASALSIMPSMHKQLPFDPVKDFAPVTTLTVYPNLVVVHPAVPAHSLKELIALAKAKAGTLNFASGGTGTGTQLTGELFASMAGISLVHVPYKGGGPAMTALLGGQVQLMFASIPSTLPFTKSGRLRVLAVTSARRTAVLPEVPSVAEAGVAGYDEVTWNGVVAPARVAAPVVQTLYRELDAVLKMPLVREKFATEGAEPGSMAPARFGQLIQSEIVKWAKLTREIGIKPE
jgi:tripartite-type tricarboxylate transporter receptor subunit TctC